MATRQMAILVATLIAWMLRATSATIVPINPAGTVYQFLEQNNLPEGLLPLGVESYVVGAHGALDVTLPGECNVFVTVASTSKQFRFVYASKVSGVIKPGSISSVSGVSVEEQEALVWHVLHKVTRAGNQLQIQLGSNTTRSFPVSAFAEITHCDRGIQSSIGFT